MLSRLTLLRRCAAHRGLVVIETRPDFDSEAFVDALVAELATVITADDPASPLVERPEPLMVTGLFGPAVTTWREVLIRRFRRELLTIMVLPKGVGADLLAAEPVPTLVVDAGALRCGVGDVAHYAAALGMDDPGPMVASAIVETGGSWPAWVKSALGSVASTVTAIDDLQQVVLAPPFRRRVIDSILTDVDPHSLDTLAQLAHLERFSAAAADAVGGFGFADTRIGHLPGVFREPTGLWAVVEPLRRELRARSELRPEVAESLVPVLTADGELLTLCRTLVDGGALDRAAAVLSEAPVAALNACSQRDLLGLLRVVMASQPPSTRLDMVLARVHDNLAQVDETTVTYRRIVESASQPTSLHLEAEAELLACQYRTISTGEALNAIDDLRERAESGRVPTPTRLREIEAKILGQSTAVEDVAAAAEAMLEVAAEWEFQHEPLRAARAIRWLAAGPLYFLGRHREAQRELARAATMAISQSFDFGLTMATKAWFDGLVGDADAHVTSSVQAHACLDGGGAAWMLAFVEWGSMCLAQRVGSPDALRRHARTVRSRLGEVAAGNSGLTLAAAEIVMLAELGEGELAAKALEALAPRREQHPVEFDLAAVASLAANDRLDEAFALWAELDVGGSVPSDRRWRIELLLLAAAGPDCHLDRPSIEREADRLGMGNLLPHVAPALYGDTRSGVSFRMQLSVLGEFGIVVGTDEVAVPNGHASDLLKLLAVMGGRCHLEVALDRLWPDTDVVLAQRRLKNVVRRLRTALGDDVLVRGTEHLALGEGVTTDLAQFEQLYAMVQANRKVSPFTARRDAVAALDLYAGPLLPDDLYDDRIADRRIELAARAEELLTVINSGPDAERPHAAWQAGALRKVGSPDQVF